jgi:hypothetical protein
MYDSNTFDKNDILEWKKQPSTKEYFNNLTKATDMYYLQNVGDNTASHQHKYESANNMVDVGNKIHKFIVKIATAAQSSNASNQFDAMAALIKALTKTISKLSTGQKNDEYKNPNAGSTGTTKSSCPQMKKIHNMDAYCHSHGFHPVLVVITQAQTVAGKQVITKMMPLEQSRWVATCTGQLPKELSSSSKST